MPLDGTQQINQVAGDLTCDTQNIIQAAQTFVDGCAVLPKMQCHEIQMGQDARLLWTFRNPQGIPVDLTPCLQDCAQNSESNDAPFDNGPPAACGIVLRLREITGMDPNNDPVFSVPVTIMNASTGLVRADSLPDRILREPGVYLEEWSVMGTNNRMLFSNQCCLFVQKGLFGILDENVGRIFGPPSISELRLSIRDNSSVDNVLLDNVEFDAAEIVSAVVRPIRYWNESPPPIRPMLTTKTFPFMEMWTFGIQAYLMDIASHNYRRNRLATNAGNMTIDDKNKEREYVAASQLAMQQFRGMVQNKKVEINVGLAYGSLSSTYAGLFY